MYFFYYSNYVHHLSKYASYDMKYELIFSTEICCINQNKHFYVDWVDLNCQLIHIIGIWFESLTGGCHLIDNINDWKGHSVKYNESMSTSMEYGSI